MAHIPNNGDTYYYLTEEGRVCWSTFTESKLDIEMLDCGRVFETPQEAHLYKDKHLTVYYSWERKDRL